MDKVLKDYLGVELNERIVNVSPLSGGDINHAAKIITTHNVHFIKWNNNPIAMQMFQTEASALQSLAATNTIAIPNVIKCSSFEDKACLILEFVDSNPNPSNEELFQFGIQLANLHRIKVDNFGFENDNYIGIIDQSNSNSESWSEFYVTQRLQPQIELAKSQSHLLDLGLETLNRFYHEVDTLLINVKPSLLHGDLWSGNYIISKNGNAYLIDPASYYGHSEVDLAMSELFGGFGSSFYEGYNDVNKISNQYYLRKEIYQLYFLLVHLNLFGKSYEKSCKSILTRFD